ncbi:glycoside hydrolase domain-containing protein [Acidobacteriota bacterium]
MVSISSRKTMFAFAAGFLLSLLLIQPCQSEDIPYGIGQWDADSLGNHRVILRVSQNSDAVLAHIPWRRRDLHPENKSIILIDAHTGQVVRNLYRAQINREYGDIVFQPQTIPGDYYVYYLPFVMEGRSNYPTVTYPAPVDTADSEWLKKHALVSEIRSERLKNFTQAEIVTFQSINEFNSFFPMEQIATLQETSNLLNQYPDSDYLLFPEDRKFPIRMTEDLPYRWIKSGLKDVFDGEAARGEFYAFQIGLYAHRKNIDDIKIRFSDLKKDNEEKIISSSLFQSINTEGINWDGNFFDKTTPVAKGKVQALWCGIQVPAAAAPGVYRGKVFLKPQNGKETALQLVLRVTDSVLEDAGDSEPWRHSRLRWLNSKLAFDEETVPPFTPVLAQGNSFRILGRKLTVGKSGFPVQIQSFFSPDVTTITDSGRSLLHAPFQFIVTHSSDLIMPWSGEGPEIVSQKPGAVHWTAKSTSGPLTLECKARIECDGFVGFQVRLSTSELFSAEDIRLEIPLMEDAALYMMGMGVKGGFRPENFAWKWDQTKNQDSIWVGDVNGGFQCSFRAENYSRPLNTNFYLSKPLHMPPSWFNDGKGGCEIKEDGHAVIIKTYSGSRTLQPGEDLYFNFNLLLTPFKPLDTQTQWDTRFYHAYEPIDKIAASGANTINNHHANEVNPFINYPFINTEKMKKYVNTAHEKGFKVKIYNTIRELSNKAAEIFAFRSLGEEIYTPGPGGGFSWLQEHIGSNYIAAWFVPKLKDAALINSGMSRWHNYYIEGLDWLAKNIKIDGLYIDDVAYDRTTMKRVRKILDRNRKGALIDLHSANQFNPRDGFASSANLYLEHFPYLNRLWFGEYFDYDSSPDYWLVEISGIPFGLMGEMLQDGGNPWRGMIYGMTSRLPWAGDPTPIWKIWDDFNIQDSEMAGYWSSDSPVRTDREDVLVSSYIHKKEGRVLIALASWADGPVKCRLNIDWETLGLNRSKAVLQAPYAEDFQDAAIFDPNEKIPIEEGKGWLLILKNKTDEK